MSVRLEDIDALKQRANVSYEDARDALEKFNGDIVEALVYLEKEKKIKSETKEKTEHSFIITIKRIIKKAHKIKFTIKKDDKVILSLPITIIIILCIFATPLVIAGVLLALFTNHRISFEHKDNKYSEVNSVLDKVSNKINIVKTKLAEDDAEPSSTN
ncbi:MAG: DUF4342 domain-containing protein [Bacillota bacterium]|nr:DUF4342 domain-containing protein [Bacillota bacterium]